MPDLRTHSDTTHATTDRNPYRVDGPSVHFGVGIPILFGVPAAVEVTPLATSGYFECPPAVQFVRLWDHEIGLRLSGVSATSLRIAFLPAEAIESVPSASSALNDLARWTDLPIERLGYVVGASRRSIYNWRRGSTVPSDVTERILRAHQALGPLATRFTPAMVRVWLTDGSPSPADLLHGEMWDDFGSVVAKEVTALVARPATEAVVVESEPEPFALDQSTRAAILARFQTPEALGPRRPDWRPAELTGLDELETDEDE